MEDVSRLIIERSADGVVIVDDAGQVRLANPTATRLFDRPVDALVGQPFGHPLVPGEITEIDLLRRDGTTVVAEMLAVAFPWEARPANLVLLRDITEQVRVREALRDAEALSRAVLDSLVTHLAVIDAEGRIVAVNEAWANFATENGAPPEDAVGVGANYFEVCAGTLGDEHGQAMEVLMGMRGVLEGERLFFEMEYPCHAPDAERWFLMRVVPLPGYRLRGLVVSHTDITAQKRAARAEAEAAALRDQLQRQLRELRALEQIVPVPQLKEVGGEPLAELLPEVFRLAVERYGAALDAALERRVFRAHAPGGEELRSLAELLARGRAAPRDVVEVHLAALRNRCANAPQLRVKAYLEEGRLAILELMGYLAGLYRVYALATPTAGPQPTADG